MIMVIYFKSGRVGYFQQLGGLGGFAWTEIRSRAKDVLYDDVEFLKHKVMENSNVDHVDFEKD